MTRSDLLINALAWLFFGALLGLWLVVNMTGRCVAFLCPM